MYFRPVINFKEAERMTDLISRQAAIDALKIAYWDNDIQSAKDDPCIVDAMTDWAIRQVKALPSADVAPVRHGTWGKVNECSECGCQPWYERDIHFLHYCPNCGARMDGEQDG